MKWILLVSLALAVSDAALPSVPDCKRLEDHVLDHADPRAIFGTSSEIGVKATPVRVGSLRSKTPLPTHHFASNMLKSLDRANPMRVFPYEAIMDRMGIVWDAYTMERWYDPVRTDLMEQQSAWEQGKPWVKLNDMGTNLKQMVSGPDGNPLGVFEGESGVRVGFKGSQEPELVDFGDLYANFLFSGNGGSMEVPVVRGATLATHIFKNANPVIKPYCLSNIAGQTVSFECPVERSAADSGSGYLEGRCDGNTLKIYLHNSKTMEDFSRVQWAALPSSQWANRAMHNCADAHCRIANNGKTIEMTIPDSHGEMSFAVNVIGHYVLPWDWVNSPMKVSCAGRRRRGVRDMTLQATCQPDRSLQITVDLADISINGLDRVQFAVDSQDRWRDGFVPPMWGCDNSRCSKQGSLVTIHTHAPDINYHVAVNIIGVVTIPFTNWISQPFKGVCDGSTTGTAGSHTGGTSSGGSNSGGSTTDGTTTEGTTADRPPTGGTTTEGTTTERFPTQPPGNSQTDLTTNTKFILELNEPGNRLPGQTRKFVLYFSQPVTARVVASSSEVHFSPVGGGVYNGIVQLGYLGAGPRGDHSQDNYLDKYHGRYSYKPLASSCVSESRGKAYLSFDWNPVDAEGNPTSGELLMTTLPHQEALLSKTSSCHLRDSLYGFKTYEGNSWLLEYDVHHTPVQPDMAAVNAIKRNGTQLTDITAAIQRDADNVNLDAVCAHSDSYNVGKAIGLVARLASISRAFGTSHYQTLDTQIVHCLNKWLRVDDTLKDKWKFRYDSVWGGVFLRGTNGELHYGVDYGFPYYNDHHFHLGYFLYAAAYYVKHHKDWGNAHKDRLYLLARDVGNPSHKDPDFPVVRHQDYYNGFSWATGVVPGERQEESASESINCYHGLAALGDAFGDPYLKHTGQLHLAMEIASVREYWQVRSHNRHRFPTMLQKNGVVGMIAEMAWYVYTLNWPCDPNRFPMRHACLVGIQVIPITAVSKYWVDQEWAASIRDVCERAINPQLDKDYGRHDTTDPEFRDLHSGWQTFCYAAMAPLDSAHQTRAADYVRNKRPQELVGGTGAASTLLFIYGAT